MYSPVFIKDVDTRSVGSSFASLDDFLGHHAGHRFVWIDSQGDLCCGLLTKTQVHRRQHADFPRDLSLPFTAARAFCLLDELGQVIEPEAILHRYRQLGLPSAKPNWRRSTGYKAERDFRGGPVPGIGHAKWHGHWYRRPATQQEICLTDFLKFDEEAMDVGLCGRGRRKRHNLPTAWDDITRNTPLKSWKRFRKHQWKY